jgi:hypothetical protein
MDVSEFGRFVAPLQRCHIDQAAAGRRENPLRGGFHPSRGWALVVDGRQLAVRPVVLDAIELCHGIRLTRKDLGPDHDLLMRAHLIGIGYDVPRLDDLS